MQYHRLSAKEICMRPTVIITAAILLLWNLSICEPILISGKITDVDSAGIPDVSVQLVKAGISTKTNSKGTFQLREDITGNHVDLKHLDKPFFNGRHIRFNIVKAKETACARIFSLSGRLLSTPLSSTLPRGSYCFYLFGSQQLQNAGTCIIEFRLGGQRWFYKYYSVGNMRAVTAPQFNSLQDALKKVSASVIDTLIISKDGYHARKALVVSYIDSLKPLILIENDLAMYDSVIWKSVAGNQNLILNQTGIDQINDSSKVLSIEFQCAKDTRLQFETIAEKKILVNEIADSSSPIFHNLTSLKPGKTIIQQPSIETTPAIYSGITANNSQTAGYDLHAGGRYYLSIYPVSELISINLHDSGFVDSLGPYLFTLIDSLDRSIGPDSTFFIAYNAVQNLIYFPVKTQSRGNHTINGLAKGANLKMQNVRAMTVIPSDFFPSYKIGPFDFSNTDVATKTPAIPRMLRLLPDELVGAADPETKLSFFAFYGYENVSAKVSISTVLPDLNEPDKVVFTKVNIKETKNLLEAFLLALVGGKRIDVTCPNGYPIRGGFTVTYQSPEGGRVSNTANVGFLPSPESIDKSKVPTGGVIQITGNHLVPLKQCDALPNLFLAYGRFVRNNWSQDSPAEFTYGDPTKITIPTMSMQPGFFRLHYVIYAVLPVEGLKSFDSVIILPEITLVDGIMKGTVAPGRNIVITSPNVNSRAEAKIRIQGQYSLIENNSWITDSGMIIIPAPSSLHATNKGQKELLYLSVNGTPIDDVSSGVEIMPLITSIKSKSSSGLFVDNVLYMENEAVVTVCGLNKGDQVSINLRKTDGTISIQSEIDSTGSAVFTVPYINTELLQNNEVPVSVSSPLYLSTPEMNVTIVPAIRTLAYSTGTGGMINIAYTNRSRLVSGSDSIALSSGTSVSLTPIPAPRYVFGHWAGDIAGSAIPYTLTLDRDYQISSVFNYGTPWCSLFSYPKSQTDSIVMGVNTICNRWLFRIESSPTVVWTSGGLAETTDSKLVVHGKFYNPEQNAMIREGEIKDSIGVMVNFNEKFMYVKVDSDGSCSIPLEFNQYGRASLSFAINDAEPRLEIICASPDSLLLKTLAGYKPSVNEDFKYEPATALYIDLVQ